MPKSCMRIIGRFAAALAQRSKVLQAYRTCPTSARIRMPQPPWCRAIGTPSCRDPSRTSCSSCAVVVPSRKPVSGDPAPLAAVSTAHDPATFFGPRGGVESGAKHVLEVNAAGSKQFSAGESHLEILQTKVDGDLGFWAGLQHATVQMRAGDQPVKMTLRVTEVFRREAGAW